MKFLPAMLCITFLLTAIPVFAPTEDVTRACYDSDGGIEYQVYGELFRNNTLIARDTCSLISEMCTTSACSEENYGKGEYLIEWYFGENCEQNHKVVKCDYGCQDGACLSPPETSVPCEDSDGGQDIFKPGTTKGIVYPYTDRTGSMTDYCLNPGESLALYESYCDAQTDQVMTVMMYCPEDHKCVNREGNLYGYCVKLVGEECYDSDRVDYYTKGYVKDETGRKEWDYCKGSEVVEFVCKDNKIADSFFVCSGGCWDGACLREAETGIRTACGNGVCEYLEFVLSPQDEEDVVINGKNYVVVLLGISGGSTETTTESVTASGAISSVSYSPTVATISVNGMVKEMREGETKTIGEVDIHFAGVKMYAYPETGSVIIRIGEGVNSCPKDCMEMVPVPEPYPIEPPTWECPVEKVCPDGVTRPCKVVDNQCVCTSCPLPENCWEEVDQATGFTRRICEAVAVPAPVCPPVPQEVLEKCKIHGGSIVYRRDQMGCEYVDCVFEEEGEPFQLRRCPSEEEIDAVLRKCEEMNAEGIIVEEGGCKFARCLVKEAQEVCPEMPPDLKDRIRNECANQGLEIVRDFDQNGCPVLRCGKPEECVQYIPEEAFRKCEERGGKLVVKRDENGCVIFHECVMRGEEEEVYYEQDVEVPETTVLLGMAFKLEELKMQFDMLARKADSIADYYRSVGSKEEDKFRRVADMFRSAASKVDEIKRNIRDNMDTMTEDDVREIKKDIKYLKDVILKDILYLMLSGEDIEEPEGPLDCGADGNCFHRALRICKQAVMSTASMNITISGLEDGRCVIKAEGPAGYMTCRVPDYSLGIENPAEQLFPYCEGTLVSVLESEAELEVETV